MSKMMKSDGRHIALKRLSLTALLSFVLLILTLSVVGAMEQSNDVLAPADPVLRIEWRYPSTGSTYAPGERIFYQVRIRNTGDPETGFLTMTLSSQVNMATVLSTTGGVVVAGNNVRWPIDTSLDGNYDYYTVTVLLADNPITRDALSCEAKATLSGSSGEDTYSSVGRTHYVIPPEIAQTIVSSVVDADNAQDDAVAGEIVTTTIVFNIPDGTVAYNVSPRVFLEDGLIAGSSQPGWSEDVVDTRTNLRDAHEDEVLDDGTLLKFSSTPVITGPYVLSYTIVTTRTQNLFAGTTTSEIAQNAPLSIQPILRWCDSSGCPLVKDDEEYVVEQHPSVYAIYPYLYPQIDYVFLDSPYGIGEGGGNVRLTISNENIGRATVYDGVVTATGYLSYTVVAPSPSPDGVRVYTDSWVLTWTVDSLVPGAQQTIVIDVTLPPTFTIGERFTFLETAAHQETFAGDVAHEGRYVGGTDIFERWAGITHKKESYPTDTDIRMGETVLYTVTFIQGANTLLRDPYYVDTLPLGFRIDGDVNITGGAVLTAPVFVEDDPGASGLIPEQLTWYMATLTPSEDMRTVVATYTVNNTGLDRNNQYVHTAGGDLDDDMPSSNSALYRWNADGLYYIGIDAVSSAVRVIQPYFRDGSSYFFTERLDAGAGTIEVGQNAKFSLGFQNRGMADAYDVTICDQMPPGLRLYTGNPIQYQIEGSTVLTAPVTGDNLICWTLNWVTSKKPYLISYYVQVDDAIVPGVPLVNNIYIQDYSSLPGDHALERHYQDIPTAMPAVEHCADPDVGCLSVLGLEVNKQPWLDNAGPSDLITYTIRYTDTSPGNQDYSKDYHNVVITDTFDGSLASFVSADPAPDSMVSGELVWDVGTVADTNGEITLTMQVASVLPDGVFDLVNTLLWASDEVPQHALSRTIGLQAANLNITMTAPSHTHADDAVAYTVTYSNTGTVATSVVTLTLDYGIYADFVNATLPASVHPVSGTDNVFTESIASDGNNHSFTVDLHIQAPLPYAEAGPLHGSVAIASRGAESKSVVVDMILDHPVFELTQGVPDVAPEPGNSMRYDISIKNIGSYTATGILITDTWGLYQEYAIINKTSYNWISTTAGAYVTQTVLALGPDESAPPVYFGIDVTEEAPSYTNTVKLGSDQTTIQQDTASVWPKTIATSKSATPVPAFPGRVLTYTIYYTNTGGALPNALITDTLPAGFVYQDHDESLANGCQYSAWEFTVPGGSGGGDAVWLCPTLFSGVSGKLLIWGEVMTTAEGSDLVNYVETSADNSPVRPIEESLVTRVARPWLRIDKVVAPTHPVAPGDYLLYTLTYENHGSDVAHNVVIEDVLPATQLTYVGCSGGDKCIYSSTHDTVIWNIAELLTGTVATVEITATVKTGIGAQDAVNSQYTIASERLNVNQTITGSPVTSTILLPHLDATKSASPDFVQESGDHITYTIAYTNDGGGLLSNIQITDTIAGNTVVDAVSAGCTISGTAGDELVICNFSNLSQGATGEVQINVHTINVEEGESIFNTAYVSSDGMQPPEATNETEVLVSTSGCVPPRNVDFTVSANPTAGESVTFSGTADGDDTGANPMVFTWHLGHNGAVKTGRVVTYIYPISNTYTVELTANNACVEPASTSQAVVVPGEPDIAVTATSFAQSAVEGSTTILEDAFVVSNTGTSDLAWSIEISPSTTTWLSISVESGTPITYLSDLTMVPGVHSDVTLFYNPSGLAVEHYAAEVIVTSDDADESSIVIPVTLDITADCEPVSAAAFTFTPASPEVDALVTFTATVAAASTSPVAYTWNFGAGEGAVLGTHIMTYDKFSTAMDYTVWMTATNACGTSPTQQEITVLRSDYQVYLPLILRNVTP